MGSKLKNSASKTRITIEGEYDLAPVMRTFGEIAKEKGLFISGRFDPDKNETVIFVKPFEAIVKETVWHRGHITETCREHEVVFHGSIPNTDGVAMSPNEIIETIIMPAKRAVDKMVTVCPHIIAHEETGEVETKFCFYVDSRSSDVEGDAMRCKNSVCCTLLDILDNCNNFSYVGKLEALTKGIRQFIEDQ